VSDLSADFAARYQGFYAGNDKLLTLQVPSLLFFVLVYGFFERLRKPLAFRLSRRTVLWFFFHWRYVDFGEVEASDESSHSSFDAEVHKQGDIIKIRVRGFCCLSPIKRAFGDGPDTSSPSRLRPHFRLSGILIHFAQADCKRCVTPSKEEFPYFLHFTSPPFTGLPGKHGEISA